MRSYYPDKWMVIHIDSGARSHYRVFACWYGGFAGSDSWKMNSGITSVTVDADGLIHFMGSSGSEYVCHPETYGCSGYGSGVLRNLMDQAHDSGTATIKVLSPENDFTTLNYQDGAENVAVENQDWR